MPVRSDDIKVALLGLIPENWRMYAFIAGAVLFFIFNPHLVVLLVKKVYGAIVFAVSKVPAIKPGVFTPTPPTSPADLGIEAPLAAAQTQIAWAVRVGNKEVLDSAINTLKALSVKAVAVMLLLGTVGLVGCSSSAKQECDYSESHSFGYQPPPPAEKERMFQAEPTLFQQEPDLAK